MKALSGVLMLCLAVAALRAAMMAFVVGLALALVVSLIRQPRETLAFLATFGLLGLAQARPSTCIVVLGIVALAVVLAGVRGKPRNQLLLIDGRVRR